MLTISTLNDVCILLFNYFKLDDWTLFYNTEPTNISVKNELHAFKIKLFILYFVNKYDGI